MKRAVWIAVPLLLSIAWLLHAAYTYYYSENLYSPNWSNWYKQGNISTEWHSSGGYGGIYSTSTGAITSFVTPPTSTQEIRATIRKTTNGTTYQLYVAAGGDVLTAPQDSLDPGPQYYRIDITGTFGTNCTITLVNAHQEETYHADWWPPASTYSTIISTMASTSAAVPDNSVVRAVRLPNGIVVVYVNNTRVLSAAGGSLAGPNNLRPGVGMVGGGSGNLMTNVDFGPFDSTNPNAISSGSISKSPYSNHIDLQWPAASDNTNGIGVYNYEIYRDGVLVHTTTGTTFNDYGGIVPNHNYNYTLKVVDYHLNSASTNFQVTTPGPQTDPPYPSTTPEGRRTGVRPTGAYWGAGGENIDVLSGNLNFTQPLLAAASRSGGVGFSLNYNSQNWVFNADSTNRHHGRDVGYGYGWRLMAGAITPVFSSPTTITHYVFTDSTGAEYNLDQNASGIWSSKESIYIYFDASANRLYFRDGSFWDFNCVAANGEPDQGVLYPTLMQDSNGNRILIRYLTSPGAAWTDSSSRIKEIEDVRAVNQSGVYKTYLFTYNSDSPVKHLTSITNTISSGEAYSFTYLTGQSLSSPFNSASYPSTSFLRRVTVTAPNTYHEFSYNGSGELTEILLPYKGKLTYQYTSAIYSSSRRYREVQNRLLWKDGTTSKTYSFTHEGSPGPDVHTYTELTDPGGVGRKRWEFGSSGVSKGLVTRYEGQHLPGPLVKVRDDFTWSLDAAGKNSYISAVLKTNDVGQTYAVQSKNEHTIDNYGNVTQVKTYDYGSLTTPIRTDNYTYLSTSPYTSRYIFNRVTSGPLFTISYDQGSLQSISGQRNWDSSMASVTARGNPTTITSLLGGGSAQTIKYNVAGGSYESATNGVTTTGTFNSTTNFSAPTAISVTGTSAFDQSIAYNAALSPTSVTNTATGAVTSMSYSSGRPSSTTSAHGAVTTYSYNDTGSPPTQTSTMNDRWSKTIFDGLGRPIKVQAGHGSGGGAVTVSEAETEYDSCGCSPTGKVKRVSLPHAPAGAVTWTNYTYDGIGRTLSAITEKESSPDTTSTTTYVYEGNTVTVTDAADKWKKYTMNVLGQITQVNEPNPASGSDYVTTYTYNSLGNLTGVSMPRPTGTQTRTFNYSSGRLTSTVFPENGTTSFTYNSDDTLATKTDAKNQVTEYSYDAYKRVTQVRHKISGVEDTCQRVDYSYDTNPYDGSYGDNLAGRLTAIRYKGGPYCETTFTEMYGYNDPGSVLKKRLRVTRTLEWPPSQTSHPSSVASDYDMEATYTYDNEGRLTATQYPSYWLGAGYHAGPNLGHTFDDMGRLKKLRDLTASSDIITNTTYNAAGQLLSMTGSGGAPSESRTYNSIGQMTQLTSGSTSILYNYHATQNNGKIISEQDVISGESVTYTYDSLNRLASAESSVNPGWGQSFSYDGFGNLTTVAVTKGTAPSLSVSYNASTNRRSGDCADANGNIEPCGFGSGYEYDAANRIVRNDGTLAWAYAYSPGNKRVWRGNWNGSATQTVDEVTYWGANGKKLGTYDLYVYQLNPETAPELRASQSSTNQYFGGKLIKNGTGWVTPDRLGSVGKYFPYGDERPSATTNGKDKFATYFRDSETGLDYAQNRYHAPGAGRFLTPDPYMASGGPADPGSWNRYAYTRGDPVNRMDASGLADTSTSITVTADALDCSVEYYLAECGGGGDGGQMGCPNWRLYEQTGNVADCWVDPGVCMYCGDPTSFGGDGQDNCTFTVSNSGCPDITPSPPETLSTKGLDCIKNYETLRYDTYVIAGDPTIGYGHKIRPGEDFSGGITEAHALALLSQDVQIAVDAVLRLVTVSLNQHQFDALVSLTFNIGQGNLARSDLLTALNAGQQVTQDHFNEFIRGGGSVLGGLVTRRAEEFSLFSNGNYSGCGY